MQIHKRILQWQADHPNITWLFWGVVWLFVLYLLFWPIKPAAAGLFAALLAG